MFECTICRSMVSNIITSGSKHYCEMCWYYEHAPILVLAKKWGTSRLFSPKISNYVYVANNQMETCGFKLFNKKVFFNKEINQNYKEIFIYKYSGRYRCLAISGYKAWPTKMANCCKLGCGLR